jgi:hypothetical protein
MTKALPLILVLIAIVLGVSYYHESLVTEVRDEVRSGVAAPARDTASEAADYKSEIPL